MLRKAGDDSTLIGAALNQLDRVKNKLLSAQGPLWLSFLLLFPETALRSLAADGDLDPGFGAQGFNDIVMQVLPLPDRRLLVGGQFNFANGVARPKIAALLPSGDLDTNFLSGFVWNGSGWINALAVQPDGKILIGGYFDQIYGTAQSGIARLYPDGSLDTTFVPPQTSTFFVDAIRVLDDGKILLAAQGDLGAVARLNPDGSLDTSFSFAPGFSWALCLLPLPDGTVYAGGVFDLRPNGPAGGLVRLSANGTLLGIVDMGVSSFVSALVRQTDGGIVFGGGFGSVNGNACNGLARFKADGSFDGEFNSAIGSGPNEAINALGLQPDGKLVVGGHFTVFNGLARNSFTRLNADGSLDPSFNPGGSGADAEVKTLAVQPDRKIVLGGVFGNINGFPQGRIARLAWDDPSQAGYICFTALQYQVREDQTNAVISLRRSGGTKGNISAQLQLADVTAKAGEDYLDPAGTVTFAEGVTSATALIPIVDDAIVESDESLTLSLTNPTGGGLLGTESTATLVIHDDDSSFQFNTTSFLVNEVDSKAVLTVTRTGALDSPASVTYTTADGSALAGADYVAQSGTLAFTNSQTAQTVSLTILDDSQAEADEQFTVALSAPTGKAILGAISNLVVTIVDNERPGGLDASFAAQRVNTLSTLKDLALMPDGRIIVPGSTNSLYCFLPNGLRDTNYACKLKLGVTALAPLPDGKLLISVNSNLVGQACGLLRMLPDGSVDAAFCRTSSANSTIECVLPLADGQIAIGGSFTIVNGVRRARVARLLENGLLDTSFNPNSGTATGPDNTVLCLAEDTGGKLFIGGSFTHVSGVVRYSLARLNEDGSFDTAYPSSTPLFPGANSSVQAMLRQPDGNLLVAGNFNRFNGSACSNLVRFTSDGGLDPAFSRSAGVVRTGGNAVIYSLAQQWDGKILISGDFDGAGGLARKCVARFGSDGVADPNFDAGEIKGGSYSGPIVYTLALQPDGKILAAGAFNVFGSSTRYCLVRLNNDITGPFRLSSVVLEPPSAATIQFTAPVAGTYVLYASDDLLTWSAVQTNDCPAGAAQISDTNGPLPLRRFYRVATQR